MTAELKKNRRILVIDDNRTIHDDVRKILGAKQAHAAGLDEAETMLFDDASAGRRADGFEIDSAYQGREGLEMVRQALRAERPYAAAFVDIRMPPGWDGITTIAHLWREDPNLEVVVCTAYSDYTWEEIAKTLGETDHLLILKKPFDNVEVRQLACALCEKWNLARQVRYVMDNLEKAVVKRTRELQEQKEQLEQTHTQLLHAQKLESIGQLAAGIAHEINTPTQYVGDNTRFLRDGVNDLLKALDQCEELVSPAKEPCDWEERVARFKAALQELDVEFLRAEIPKAVEQSLEGLERVTRIVRAMKDFSHPGTEGKEAVDLNKAIESTVTVARNEWKYVAELVTDFDPAMPPVPCLVGEFNQVILNIVINAAHAIVGVVGKNTGEKGTITIATRYDSDWAEIRISDTGTGIPEEHRSKVFDHFFTTKEVGKGTGQGLAIAYAVITEKHGGTITLETEMGQGTTFIIRLPIETESATAEEITRHEEAHSLR